MATWRKRKCKCGQEIYLLADGKIPDHLIMEKDPQLGKMYRLCPESGQYVQGKR